MARIVITTFGSSGDLNPFIALGLGLKARGHRVLFAVEDVFRPSVVEAGFEIHHLTGDPETALAAYQREMYGSSSPFSSLKVIIDKYIAPTLHAKIEELKAACVGADLLVAASQQFAASAVSELTGIKWVTVSLTPATIPSAYVDPQPWPFEMPGPVHRLANRASWELGLAMLRPLIDKPINAVRAEFGLIPRRNLMNTGNLSPLLTALATSSALIEPQPDWPKEVRVTGFCFWDTPGNWQESADLTAFLDSGQPVVAVSSGSMGPTVSGAFDQIYQSSIAAIRQLGARALIIGAAPGSLPEKMPQDVMALPFAPFSLIYPRCAAVIHHGGIGTTGQALRAGVPMLIVPWGADQFFTGALIARKEVGRWVARRKYTPQNALKQLGPLLNNSAYTVRAKQVAAQIAQEDGVGNLCEALEEVLATSLIAK